MSRILVIEDDQLLNGGLCFNLQNAGYETIPVYDLKNAYPVVKSQKFDLMLLDVNLPDGNGFDFAREIQGFNQKPLIFLTAMNWMKKWWKAFLWERMTILQNLLMYRLPCRGSRRS